MLLGLCDKNRPALADFNLHRLPYFFRLVADDDVNRARGLHQRDGCAADMRDQWATAQLVKNFGRPGAHPRAKTGGENQHIERGGTHRCNCLRVSFHKIKNVAQRLPGERPPLVRSRL